MSTFEQGTTVHLETTIYNEADTATDPVSLSLTYRTPSGAETTIAFGSLTNQSGAGVWSYDLPVAEPGTWTYRWTATTPSVVDEGTFQVAASAIGGTRSTGAGPCQAWCEPGDLTEGGWTPPTNATTAVLERACAASSQACFELGGRRWPGLFWDSVLPTLVRGSDVGPAFTIWPVTGGGLAAAPGMPGSERSWFVGSEWANMELLDLGAEPVTAIEQVVLSGVVLAASKYRLVNSRYLVRIDGSNWAYQNDPRWDPPLISVDFTYGAAPPPLGFEAAVGLAKQMVLSMVGDDGCTLNRRVRQVIRENLVVDIAVPGLIDSLREGYTGVPEVDLFVASVNPHHLGRAARVIVPGQAFPTRIG